MTALTQDRRTPERSGEFVTDPMAASTLIHAGALVVLDSSGNAAPATAATGLVPRGVAQGTVDNSDGSAGDKAMTCRTGVFAFDNDGASPVKRTDIGSQVYLLDDHTLSTDDDSSSRSQAGPVVDVDDDGVWIQIG